MWVAKLKFKKGEALLASIVRKHSVSLSGYPISFHRERSCLKVWFIGFLQGPEKNKKNFLKNLKKSKRVISLEETDSFITGEIKESVKTANMYNYRIIHLEPVTINQEGIETWVVGAWEKQTLLSFIELIENKYKGELVSILNKKITNIALTSVNPELTKKQKQAMVLSIEKGYYNYPRKISLKELSKIAGCSYSTFQSHVRKAELKIIPHIFGKKFNS